MEKEIKYTKHVLKRASDRGVEIGEIEEVLMNEKCSEAKYGRLFASKIFSFNKVWEEKYYEQKEVIVIFKEENGRIVVITTIARYFN